jgi:hypothetical protein
MPARSSTAKLAELYLYVADRVRQDRHPGLGRIRVAKLLFFADFGAYARFGQSITGAQYWADEFGPAPVDELIVTRDLEAEGALRWDEGRDRQRIPVPQRRAMVHLFRPQEIPYVDERIDAFRRASARMLVDKAHEFPGWRFAWEHVGPRSPVPFESVFWSPRRDLTEAHEVHARRLAEEFGMPVA